MANVFLTGETIASAAIVGLHKNNVLLNTIFRDAETDFTGGRGDTVSVRVESLIGEARTYNLNRSSEIVMDEIEEVAIPVTLDTFLYKGVNVNDEDLTLDIVDFNRQVLNPLVKSVANSAEKLVADELSALSSGASGDYDDVLGGILEGEQVLNDNDVPLEDRVLVVGSGVRKALLKSDNLLRVDASGSDDALRNATIGDLFGMPVVYSNRVAADSAFIYHKTAFAGAFKALQVPAGATTGANIAENGLSLRFIADYDPRFQRDRAVVSILCGISTVEDDGDVKRAVRINFS